MVTLSPDVISNLAQKRLTAQNQRQTGLQNFANQYNTNVSSLGDYQKDMGSRINNQMASQGLFDSTIRMDEQGKMQKTVGQKRGYLDQLYAQQKTGVESGYQNALQGISDYQTQAMQDQTRQDLAQQQSQAQMDFQNRQAAQAQANWQAEQMRAGQLSAGGGAGGVAAPVGPSQGDIQAWMAAVAANEERERNAAIMRWYAALAAQNPSRDEYAGFGNAIGNPGARFK